MADSGFAHKRRGIELLDRAGTQIAIPARVRRFAEIGKQNLTATAQRLCQPQKRVQPHMVRLAPFRGGGAFIYLRAAQAKCRLGHTA